MKWRFHFSRLTEGHEPLSGGERMAGVLVPVGLHPDHGEVLVLTKRTQHVKTHKGQISFPGGLWEPGDRSLQETALREAEEEIGLRRQDVQLVGPLPPVRTRATLPIQPWVGYFSLPYEFSLNAMEVDRILLLPVNRLMDEGLPDVKVAVGSYQVVGPGIEVDGEIVWGATARILYGLLPDRP